MVLQKVDELTEPPVVGQYYLVQVVHGRWCGKTDWFPVMGTLHEDTKFFAFNQDHYHLDRRFIPSADVRSAIGSPLHATRAYYESPTIALSEPKWARRKCRDSFSEFPTHHKQVGAMQRHLAGAQCQRHETGWICPHRGFRLGSVEAGPGGVIVCPLHGLQIDAASGKVK